MVMAPFSIRQPLRTVSNRRIAPIDNGIRLGHSAFLERGRSDFFPARCELFEEIGSGSFSSASWRR
jgi:hypothetical protein